MINGDMQREWPIQKKPKVRRARVSRQNGSRWAKGIFQFGRCCCAWFGDQPMVVLLMSQRDILDLIKILAIRLRFSFIYLGNVFTFQPRYVFAIIGKDLLAQAIYTSRTGPKKIDTHPIQQTFIISLQLTFLSATSLFSLFDTFFQADQGRHIRAT